MSSMSAIYLDTKTTVPTSDTGPSIFDQMMAELRGKHKALVDELTEFRKQRFPEVALDDTQTFNPIEDEILVLPATDVTTVDEIEVVPSEREERKAIRKAKRVGRKLRRAGWRQKQANKIRNYLYEHWGISYEPRHKD
jgi:hypothetical protein